MPTRINHRGALKARGRLVRGPSWVIAAGCLAGAAVGQTYHVRDLGTLGGLGDTQAFGLSRTGANPIVVGYATRQDHAQHGFVFDGVMQELLPLAPDTQSAAYSVDGAGRVVGVMFTLGELTPRAFRTLGASVEDLGAFTPQSANDGGDIAGFISVEAATGLAGGLLFDHACVYRPPAAGGPPVVSDLGTLGSSHWSRGYAINNAGWVAGCSGRTDDTGSRAVVWCNGVAIDLGTLGGTEASAHAINDGGTVAGYSTRESMPAVRVATVWTLGPTGEPLQTSDLGTLPTQPGSGAWSYAFGINSRGAVVGQSNGRGFIHEFGLLHDLNAVIPPGWFIASARAINDSDAIAAWGVNGAGEPRALLLIRCDGDFNRDGTVGVQDIFEFLNAYFMNSPRADLDHSGLSGVQDIFEFLALYFIGCP